MAVLNAAAGHLLNRLETELTGVAVHQRKTGWDCLSIVPKGTDVVVMGDSTGICAVSPDILDAELKSRSMNLCTNSYEMLTGAAWMMDLYIRRHGPPDTLILVNYYINWYEAPTTLKNISLPPWTLALRRPSGYFAPSDWLHSLLNANVTLYRRNVSLQNAAWSRVDGERDVFFLGRGFTPARHHDASNFKADLDLEKKIKEVPDLAFNKRTTEALEEIRVLAERHGVRVVFVDNPIYDGLMAFPGFRAYYRQHQGLMRAMAKSSPRFHYMDRPVLLKKPYFMDLNHAQWPGAAIYTRAVADFVRGAIKADASNRSY